MASSDARPFPLKNTAFRVVFPIFDKTGALVTGASGLDSEVSKDQGTFADCTNEATEIATSSGVYYLDLTSTEMNADNVTVIVKTSTTDARTTVLSLYPVEDGDIRVNVVQFGGTAGTFSGGRPEVNASHAAGTAWNSGAIGASTLASDTITAAKIAADAITAAKIADNAIDAGAIASNAITSAKIASGAITSSTFAAGAIDAAAIAADAIGASELAADAVAEIQSGLATASALSTVSSYIDTEVAAIKAKTDNLPASPAAVGDIPSAASIATAVMGSTIEGSYDLTEMTRLFAAALLGKSSGHGTGTVVYRDTGDTKDRIEATVDAGDRDSVTLDAS